MPPVASSVAIVRVPAVDQPITTNYVYTDANADVQGTSTLRWVRSPSNNLDAETNVAATHGYTPWAGDVARFLFFA